MAELNARDAKIIQYLNEVYGKEKQLETALQAHIAMTTRAPYKKRLQQHLKETKNHAKQLERRIKKLGGTAEVSDLPGPEVVAEAAQRVAGRAKAAAQGPLHMLRGTSEQEKLLKNAKTEYQDEAEEIAAYTAIEALATSVGDKDTATLAKGILREEVRMRDFLAKLIPQLTKAVAQAEIPAAERRTTTTRRRSASASSSRSAGSRSSSGSRSTGSRRSSSGSRSAASRSSASTSRSSASTSRSSSSRSSSNGSSSSRANGSSGTRGRAGSSSTRASKSSKRSS